VGWVTVFTTTTTTILFAVVINTSPELGLGLGLGKAVIDPIFMTVENNGIEEEQEEESGRVNFYEIIVITATA